MLYDMDFLNADKGKKSSQVTESQCCDDVSGASIARLASERYGKWLSADMQPCCLSATEQYAASCFFGVYCMLIVEGQRSVGQELGVHSINFPSLQRRCTGYRHIHNASM